jgi:hypothetical protein
MHTNGGYYRLMIFHTVFIAAIVSTACSQVLDLSKDENLRKTFGRRE